ncbi:MAG: hypothetical protein ACREQK_04225 [Candidatus Binatia bacterium]
MRDGSTVRAENLIEEDILATQRYIDEFCKKALMPEERLILAILEDAVITFQKYAGVRAPTAAILFQEAEDWIMERGDDRIFSFEHVCETLDLNADYIRRGLTRWKEKNSKRRFKPGKRPSWIQLHRVDSAPKVL